MTRGEASELLNARAVTEGGEALGRFLALRARHRMDTLAPVLRPYLLSRAQQALLARTTLELWQAMHRVLQRWEAGALADAVPLPALVVERAREEIRGGHPFGHVRFDFTFEPQTQALGLLEVQAGDPSGMGMQHVLAEHFAPELALAGASCESVASSLRRSIAPEPLRAGLVVFAIQRSAFVQFDHALVAQVFRAEGVDAVLADPDELSFDGAALRWRGRRVDRVVRDSLEDLLEPRFAEASRPLLDAWVKGAVAVDNPAGSVVADSKVLLSLLPEVEPGPAARAAYLKTRRLERAHQQAVSAARAQWVLKPSDGYGGFGVVVGPAVDDAAWSRSLCEALEAPRPFILQEYRAPPTEDFPVPDEHGGVTLAARNVVLSTWVHRGCFGGVFARVHAGPVVNVHQGGGLLPVGVVDE
ncbi:MAG: circularly permuted type 2 ATP-grasp protein [Myxococcales bacterium]|nr:circularly permuted type 2 ATP-grasp protein [Myxococcales bacterium]